MTNFQTLIPYLSDVLLALAAFGAGLYCFVLSRRILRLSRMDEGVGGAIASLSAQVDEMQALLTQTRKAMEKARSDLQETTQKAVEIGQELELLIAACHDLEPAPPRADVQMRDALDGADMPDDDTAEDTAQDEPILLFRHRAAAQNGGKLAEHEVMQT